MSGWYWLCLVVLAGATGWHQGRRSGWYWHPSEVRRRRVLAAVKKSKK